MPLELQWLQQLLAEPCYHNLLVAQLDSSNPMLGHRADSLTVSGGYQSIYQLSYLREIFPDSKFTDTDGFVEGEWQQQGAELATQAAVLTAAAASRDAH
jgi:hypothetical protein